MVADVNTFFPGVSLVCAYLAQRSHIEALMIVLPFQLLSPILTLPDMRGTQRGKWPSIEAMSVIAGHRPKTDLSRGGL
jgi:hypothetical protein